MTTAERIDAELSELGFVDQGETRMGGRQWALAWNRYLTFVIHHQGGDELVFTWVVELGEYFEELDMMLGAGETSMHELYPRYDVKLPIEADAVRAEVQRTLSRLDLQLNAPEL
jgi:hypothetical protein